MKKTLFEVTVKPEVGMGATGGTITKRITVEEGKPIEVMITR